LPLRRRDGSSRWVHMAMQPVFDADGMLHEFVAVLTDVTERREADETLRRSTALLEATQSTAHVGGWALDVATGRLYWSAETYRGLHARRVDRDRLLHRRVRGGDRGRGAPCDRRT
jgi:PAS domain-containing protein